MTELKPCPFCGAAASAWEWNGGARVDCSKWGADAYSVYTHYVGIGARTMKEAIELWNRRAAQPERKRGKWIEAYDPFNRISGRCSVCGWEAHLYEDDVVGMNYCPNCGADMRGEQDGRPD